MSAAGLARGAPARAAIRRHHPLTPYLFLLPACGLLLLFFFAPAFFALYLSFTSYDAMSAPAWNHGANYAQLWGDEAFWVTLKNSLYYLGGVVPPLVVLPLLLALLVERPLPGMAFFRAAYYLPVVISMVVVGVAWKWLYEEQGLLNWLAQATGLSSEGLGWLTDPRLALGSVMAVTVWKGLGYYMVIYLASLQTIPRDLHEAAMIDGAGTWQRHWHITLPLMRPAMALVAVISSISAMKVFTEIYVMTKGGPLDASKTLVFYLYERAFEGLDIGYACALGVVLFGLIFGLTLVHVKLGEQGAEAPK